MQEANEAATAEELLECPDHQPSSFLKGKPRSILSLPCFYKYFEYLLFVDDAFRFGENAERWSRVFPFRLGRYWAGPGMG